MWHVAVNYTESEQRACETYWSTSNVVFLCLTEENVIWQVRMQAYSGGRDQSRYANTFAAFRSIYKHEGVSGLYKVSGMMSQ